MQAASRLQKRRAGAYWQENAAFVTIDHWHRNHASIRTTIDDVTFLVLPNGVVISGRVVQWGTDAYRWEWMDFEIAAPECSARPFEFVGLEGAPRPRHAQGSRNEVPFFNKADSRPKFLLRHYLRSAEAE